MNNLLRGCDSRNVNLSPLCQLSSTSSLLKLQPEVNGIYGNSSTEYTSSISGPVRREYPTDRMRQEELLTPLAKVFMVQKELISTKHFVGKPDVQCLRERHCRGQHILWNFFCL